MIAGIEAQGGSIQDAATSVASENPVAAMPSVHFALALLIAFAAWRGPRPLRFLAAAYVLAMAFALVYLGEHYLVDLLAAALLTTLALCLATRLLRPMHRVASVHSSVIAGARNGDPTGTIAAHSSR